MKRVDPLAGVTTFLTLADLKSFTATAKRLQISAATVSAQIADLETRLGVRLVHRSTRYVTLTEAGDAYRASLDGLLEQAERGASVVASLRGEVGGTLKIAAPYELSEWLLPKIDMVIGRHPKLVIDLHWSNTPMEMLGRGYDAVVGRAEPADRRALRMLRRVELYLVASPRYLARRIAPRTVTELAEHELIATSGAMAAPLWQFTGRSGTSAEVAARPRLASDFLPALRQWAVAGHGIALLPDHMVERNLAVGDLMPVLPDWSVPGFDLALAHAESRFIAPKLELLANALADAADEPAATWRTRAGR